MGSGVSATAQHAGPRLVSRADTTLTVGRLYSASVDSKRSTEKAGCTKPPARASR